MPLDLDAIQALYDAAEERYERATAARDDIEIEEALADKVELASEIPDLLAELRVTLAVAEAADRVMNGRAVQSELRAALTAWHEYRGEATS